MSNATKSLLGIFGVLLVITGLVKWVGTSNGSKDLETKILNFNLSKINQVHIDRSRGRNITLKRNGRKWQVSQTGKDKWYQADTNAVYSAIDRLSDLMPQTVVTRDTSQFIRYRVDTSGTRVTLFQGTKPMADIIIGKFSYNGPRSVDSYVRPYHRHIVFSVNGFLSSEFNRTLDDWRDKNVWQINRKNITQVDLEYPADSSFSVIRVADGKWTNGKDTLKLEAVNDMLDRLASLRATSFADSLKPSAFGKPLYKIVLHLKGNATRQIRIKREKNDKSQYLLTATGYPYVFRETRPLFNSDVLRSKKAMIKKAVKKKKSVKKKK